MKEKIKEVLTQCAVLALGGFLVSVGQGLSSVVQEQVNLKVAEKSENINWKEALDKIK